MGGLMDDRGLTLKRFIKPWENDEPCEVTIVQKSKSVWIAVGTHMGKEVRVQGRSANSAAALWRDAAHSRSN
jgi:hypothetical protein